MSVRHGSPTTTSSAWRTNQWPLESASAWMPNPDTIFEDLAALAAQTRRRGDPQPQWRMDAMARGRERAKEERLRKARERTRAAQRKRFADKRARTPVRLRFLLAMESDAWYGWKELGRSIDQHHDTANAVRWMFERDGWIEGAANPKWTARTPGRSNLNGYSG